MTKYTLLMLALTVAGCGIDEGDEAAGVRTQRAAITLSPNTVVDGMTYSQAVDELSRLDAEVVAMARSTTENPPATSCELIYLVCLVTHPSPEPVNYRCSSAYMRCIAENLR